MTSRFLICENIVKKAEEDLLSILISEEPNPEQFNYSPYILRSVNDKLLEEGKSIGLGYISDKSIIDSYWETNPYKMTADLEMRIVYGTHCNCSDELLLFLKNNEVRGKIISELDSIPKLRIRNNFLFRFRTQTKDNTIDDICEQIRILAIDKELDIKTEVFYLSVENLDTEDYNIRWRIPENFLFRCLQCNFCEYPSNFSANPIPNNRNAEEFLLTFENRICFPCNLPSLSYYEAIDISNKKNLPLSEFSRPIFGKQNKEMEIVEVGFSIKQREGLCVFQDIKENQCQIYDIAPFNCKFYPLLLSSVEDNIVTVEVDFSCPGIGKGDKIDLKKSEEHLKNYLNASDTKINLTIDEIEEKWGKQTIWKEGMRVTAEDVKFAKTAFFT